MKRRKTTLNGFYTALFWVIYAVLAFACVTPPPPPVTPNAPPAEDMPPPAPVEPAAPLAECEPQTETPPVEDAVNDRAAIAIITEPKQEARYDGTPKRITARAEPPVPLSFSYYPSETLRGEAAAAVLRAQRKTELPGLRRVESAPVEPGTYFALVYFAGNEQFFPAFAEVDFTIRAGSPPARLP
jgi:hypothetical protein